MKNLKHIAFIAVIVIAVILLCGVVYLSASYFFSLSAQTNQNTKDIQSIVNFINQQAQPLPTSTK